MYVGAGEGGACSGASVEGSSRSSSLLGLGETILERSERAEGLVGAAGAWSLQGRPQPQAASMLAVGDNERRKFLGKTAIQTGWLTRCVWSFLKVLSLIFLPTLLAVSEFSLR